MLSLLKFQGNKVSDNLYYKCCSKGFTLVELVITIAIVGILAAIAMPNYKQYVIRTNRAAAQSQMMDIANREQQFLMANRLYVDAAELEASGYSLPPEVSTKYEYTISVDNDLSPPYYLITFSPIDSQATDGDLTLDSAGGKSPADKW
jgi:type IV pilus assembly protein PilE